MINVDRYLRKAINQKLFKGKTIVVLGQRQVGKTTLVKQILAENKDSVFFDGDDSLVRDLFSQNNTELIKRNIGDKKVVFIDEAQRINHIGITAKIIHDNFKDVQLILSGSSALDLNQSIKEALTGRIFQFNMYPISWGELEQHYGFLSAQQQLNDRIVFGMYPDVLNYKGEEISTLKNLTESYLYKDILALTNIKKPEVLDRLLQALAYQLGNEVSYNELAQLLQINKETVSSYIQLLEKAFIIFTLKPYSKNLRNEIKANKKIYFYDNGIRNAVINAFNPIDLRNDKGALWENFLISERIKHLSYSRQYVNYYYWRTKDQQEVDWVEEKNLAVKGFEFKWSAKANYRFPKKFVENYSKDNEVIHRDNFFDFVV